MNVGLLYYRPDLLARHGFAPPRTYDEMVVQIRQILAAEPPPLDGYLWQGKQYEGLVVNVLEELWANGTRPARPWGRHLSRARRARRRSSPSCGACSRRGISPRWVTAADEELGRRAFGDGRAIFYRGWPYALDLFELPDSPVRGKVGIAPLPRHATAGSAPDRREARTSASTGTRLTRGGRVARPLSHQRGRAAPDRGERGPLAHTDAAVRAIQISSPGSPSCRAILALALAARPRPVTPYYLVLSTSVQPELSAALVGVKTPAQSVRDARQRLAYLLGALAPATR